MDRLSFMGVLESCACKSKSGRQEKEEKHLAHYDNNLISRRHRIAWYKYRQ